MTNDWEKATYKIQLHLDGQIFTQEVSGVVSGGFGIHECGGAWNITHLATGWNSFSTADENGAKIIAQYLTDHYPNEFERLKISGTTIENFRPLAEKIAADDHLAHLRELYADDSFKAEKRANQMSLKIIS